MVELITNTRLGNHISEIREFHFRFPGILIFRYLGNKVTDYNTKPELSLTFPSTESILEEMRTIRCIEHDGHRKFITPFVGDQVAICDAFGFEIPEGCRSTYTSRKSTKGKRGRPAKPKTEDQI